MFVTVSLKHSEEMEFHHSNEEFPNFPANVAGGSAIDSSPLIPSNLFKEISETYK